MHTNSSSYKLQGSNTFFKNTYTKQYHKNTDWSFFNQNSNHIVAYTCAFFAFAIKISAWKCKKCHLQEKKIAGFEVVKKNQYV